MSANDAAVHVLQQRFAILCLFLATLLCGCTSRIVRPDSLEASRTRQSVQGQEQREITFSVYPRRSEPELANAFRETCSSLGINAREAEESSGRSDTHVALYELEQEPHSNPAILLLGLATLFLTPACEEMVYPIELHLLQSAVDTRRPRVFRDQYVIDECTWIPTLIKDLREQRQLRDTALRLILAKAVETTLMGR